MSAKLVTLEGDCYGNPDAVDFSEMLGIDIEDFKLLSGGPREIDLRTEAYLRDKYMGFIPLVAAVGAANTLRKTGFGKKIGKLFKGISFKKKKKSSSVVPKVVTQVGVPASVTTIPQTVTVPTSATISQPKLVQISKVPTAYLIGAGVLGALLLLRR